MISLAMWSILVPSENPTDIDVPQELSFLIKETFTVMASSEGPTDRWETAEALGQSNLYTSEIKSPSQNTVEEMLYKLCGGSCYDDSWRVSDTHVNSHLNDKNFAVYVGLILFFTALMAGWGLEVFVWVMYLQTWDTQREYWWRFAQFFFPVLLATTLGLAVHQNYLALPILVVSLWKFGFPETVMYLYLGVYGKKSSKLQRASDFLNGVGTAVHHSAAVFMECMLLAGAFSASRPIYDLALILIVQHWFALLPYVNTTIYVVVETGLEIWLDWIAISQMFHLRQQHWIITLDVCVFLAAHWTYFIAGGLGLVAKIFEEDNIEENIHVRGTTWYRRRSTICKADEQHVVIHPPVSSEIVDNKEGCIAQHQNMPLRRIPRGMSVRPASSTEMALLRVMDEVRFVEL